MHVIQFPLHVARSIVLFIFILLVVSFSLFFVFRLSFSYSDGVSNRLFVRWLCVSRARARRCVWGAGRGPRARTAHTAQATVWCGDSAVANGDGRPGMQQTNYPDYVSIRSFSLFVLLFARFVLWTECASGINICTYSGLWMCASHRPEGIVNCKLCTFGCFEW